MDEASARSADDVVIPPGLVEALRRKMKNANLSWDQALQQIVKLQQSQRIAS